MQIIFGQTTISKPGLIFFNNVLAAERNRRLIKLRTTACLANLLLTTKPKRECFFPFLINLILIKVFSEVFPARNTFLKSSSNLRRLIGGNIKNQTAKRRRLFWRRLFTTLLPPALLILTKNPCFFFLFPFFGLNVLLITSDTLT